ncbi:hypothetical protein AB0284_20370 [Pseudarthrobacter phenanthrenivorans]|uniref:hypothetical protein n=1 Tax=Pseudarthrobacter phenanthrenivorans TaxID=361575 RepID=UPI00344BC418
MTFLRLPLVVTASALLALVLAGCSAPHDLSINESCRQWKQLGKGQWRDVRGDLVAAEPRMHEAVSKQVQIYIDALGPANAPASAMSDADADAAWKAKTRLDSICGS